MSDPAAPPTIEQLVCRLKTAAYIHGGVDAEARWSDKKYADACDKSDAAEAALLAAIRALPQPKR